MDNQIDTRDDKEGALLLIKKIHREGGGKLSVSPDADPAISLQHITDCLNQSRIDADVQRKSKIDVEGRYSLEEAGKKIEEETGERADEMTRRLMAGAHSGALPVYEPGKNAPYQYGEGFASRVRDFYEEAYWDDLNAWLAANASRITFRFPDPSGAPEKAAPPAPVATSAAQLPRQRHQENEILRVITEKGYSASALPKAPPGKAGAKASVRAGLNFSAGVFNKAWERLRASGEIKNCS